MRVRLAAPLLLPFLLGLGCAEPGPRSPAGFAPLPPPAATAERPVDLPGLHNVVTYAPGYVCGGVPEGEPGFATLSAMGIRAIVSVDGAAPDQELAAAHGMHYVHLPIGYDGIPAERALAIAQAVSSLPGPVYVHCHHGKHRSAAALGTAAVMAGLLTTAAAEARMRVSGTAAEYEGLWRATRTAQKHDPAQLHVDAARFAAVEQVKGLIRTMVAIDGQFDDLKVLQKADWQVPVDHPDLEPTRCTGRLRDLFTSLADDADVQAHPPEFRAQLAQSTAAAVALDAALRQGNRAAAQAQFDLVSKSCKACHKVYRDR